MLLLLHLGSFWDKTLSACTFEVVGTPAVGAWALARLALAFITLLGVAFYLEMSFLAAVAAALVFFHHVDTERLVLYCDTLRACASVGADND